MSERRIKILAITLVFLLNVTSGGLLEGADRTTGMLRAGLLLVFMIIQWEGAHLVIKYGRKKYPALQLVRKRVYFTALYFIVISVLLQLLTDVALENLLDNKPFQFDFTRLVGVLLQAGLFALTTIGMFEAIYYYSHFSQAELEKDALRRANLQSRFDSLKGQVKPHFLFNSLNTLSSLITKDALKAEQFVEELSNVYRFLLRSNQQELTSLKDELEFIGSYLHLLTTRFGDNLRVDMHIDEKYYSYLLPPLTLQLLVENAVKHNVISSEAPLQLKIFTTESDRLHVVNNLQKKTREVFSEKVGLQNIMDKYQLLRQPAVEVKETVTEFMVLIPLIKAEEYARINR